MPTKMIPINSCEECPNCFWYDSCNCFECARKSNYIILDVSSIPSWCPLPDVPHSNHDPKNLTSDEHVIQ
jgi:hypothetical protein